MPVIEHNTLNAAAAPIEGDEEQRGQQESESLLFDAEQPNQQQNNQGNYKNDLLDLMGLGGEADAKPTINGSSPPKQQANKSFGLEDLLGGLSTSDSNGNS